jgi:hypothetical protein
MIEEKLGQIGFTSFIHLNPLLRDKKRRMVWSGSYNDQLIAIRIVFSEENQSWVLENIHCDLVDERLKVLLQQNKIDSILDFIKSIQVR